MKVWSLRFLRCVFFQAIPNIFSAGLDIKELYNSDLQRLENFYTAVQDVLLKFLELDFAAAAAINVSPF